MNNFRRRLAILTANSTNKIHNEPPEPLPEYRGVLLVTPKGLKREFREFLCSDAKRGKQ